MKDHGRGRWQKRRGELGLSHAYNKEEGKRGEMTTLLLIRIYKHRPKGQKEREEREFLPTDNR